MTETEWLVSEDPAAMLRVVDGSFVNRVKISDRKLRLWVEACRHAAGGSDYFDIYNAGLRLAVEYWCGEDGRPLSRADRAALLRDIVGDPFRIATRHNLYLTGDPDAPASVKDGNGEVVLGLCRDCGKGESELSGPCRWLTPQVLSLARAAYDERAGRNCEKCKGKGERDVKNYHGAWETWGCEACGGTGRIDDGTLDPARLGVLADGLEEAGCVGETLRCDNCLGSGTYTVNVTNSGLSAANGYSSLTTYSEWRGCRYCGGDYSTKGSGRIHHSHPLLAHLRSPGPHVRGCFVLDLILGRE